MRLETSGMPSRPMPSRSNESGRGRAQAANPRSAAPTTQTAFAIPVGMKPASAPWETNSASATHMAMNPSPSRVQALPDRHPVIANSPITSAPRTMSPSE